MVGAKVTTKKRPEDFAKMEIAGQCVAAMHQAVRELAAPGVATRDLDAVAAEVARERGCRPSFLGYHGF
ncbi:MAG: type I methionyl aminopeptidase, partial [Actinomycetia bacterium]|nr:type I methionyl aminopeptidase [Actinomycetes bacterium]